MVRGRRGRATTANASIVPANNTTTTTKSEITETPLLNGSQLLLTNTIANDEQYYASPKRKESKFEKLTSPININGKILRNTKINGFAHHQQQQQQSIVKETKNLKTQKSIQKYFPTRTRKDLLLFNGNDDGSIPSDKLVSEHLTNFKNGSLSIESTEDENELDNNNSTGMVIHSDSIFPPNIGGLMDSIPLMRRSRDSGSSETNLFLQEPVLSLNIDKSPNQPSSIKINKVLEVEPIFSAPNGYQINLNGQFNKIVTLNGTSPKRSGSSDIEINLTNYTGPTTLLNTDSNSCDSGVVIDRQLELSPTKRRKPATPHRILCPSPVKQPLVVNGKLSPSKIKSSTATSSYLNVAQRRYPKSRRRLNTNQSENNSSTAPASPQLIGGVRLTNETLKKLINTKQSNNLALKTVLNSAKYPTAEQNTNNNNIKSKQPSINGHSQDLTGDDEEDEEASELLNIKAPIEDKIQNHTKIAQNGKAVVQPNRQLSDFFPVRRSVRKTKTAVKEEMMRTLEKAILEERQEGLKIQNFGGKGRGIVAEREFRRGEFVIEYIGDLIDMTEANKREKKYALDENAGCYMYYFKHKNQQYCIDATAESEKLGRLVNHSRNGNLMTKVVVVKSRPHLVLIAKEDIEIGEELTYDYGDRSREALIHHPWLAL